MPRPETVVIKWATVWVVLVTVTLGALIALHVVTVRRFELELELLELRLGGAPER